jgi:hypothetical protein
VQVSGQQFVPDPAIDTQGSVQMIQVFGLGFQAESVALVAYGSIFGAHAFIRARLARYAIPSLASPGGLHPLPEGRGFSPRFG